MAGNELDFNVEVNVTPQPVSEEQESFNKLHVEAKLARLDKLIQKSQLYSQIIVENMMEKSIKKRQDEEQKKEPAKDEEDEDVQVYVRRRPIAIKDDQEDLDGSGLDGSSDLESESESESDSESESKSESESETSDSDSLKLESPQLISDSSELESVAPTKEDTTHKSNSDSEEEFFSLVSQSKDVQSSSDIEVIELDLGSDSAPDSHLESDRRTVLPVRSTVSARQLRKNLRTSRLEALKKARTEKAAAENKKKSTKKRLKSTKGTKKRIKLEKPTKRSKATRRALLAAQANNNLSQPLLVTGCTMKDYQLDGLEWLITLYENGLNGILADEMGLGKTLQSILILSHLMEHGIKGPFLIIAPLSTVKNWCNEFRKFAPKIKVMEYSGNREERYRYKFGNASFKAQKWNVVVTSYQLVINDFMRFSRPDWKYLIVDEGHRIKNFNSVLFKYLKRLKVDNRLLLTGTPLQNNLLELWSLLNFTLPDVFPDLELFQEWFDFDAMGEQVADNFSGQERAVIKLQVQDRLIQSLHQVLKPFMLRRLKKDVMKELPPKKEYLVYTNLTPIQKLFYSLVLDNDLKQTVLRLHIKEYVLCNHKKLFKDMEDLDFVDSFILQEQTVLELQETRKRKQIYDRKALQRLESRYDAEFVVLDDEYISEPSRSDTNESDSDRSFLDVSQNTLGKDRYTGEDTAVESANDFTVYPSSEFQTINDEFEEMMMEFSKKNEVAPGGALQNSEVNAVGALQNGEENPDGALQNGEESPDGALQNGKVNPDGALQNDDETPDGASHSLNSTATGIPPQSDVISISSDEEENAKIELKARVKILSNKDTPRQARQRSLLKSLWPKFHQNLSRKALANRAMQLRNICGSHYLYYEPSADNVSDDEYLSRLIFQNSSKIQLLKQILNRLLKEGHKVLIFSQFTKMLELIGVVLSEQDISFSLLTGEVSQEEREEEIALFASTKLDANNVFLLSTRAGGLGINLVEADTIILFDNDWNPQMDIQAMGRAHRIGQKKPVKVFRFVIRDTVEEILIMRSFDKRVLEQQVIKSNSFNRSSVARKLVEKNIDLGKLTKLSSVLNLGSSLDLEVKRPSEPENQLLTAEPTPVARLSEEEMNELMDRSDECYARETIDFPNIDTFEVTSSADV